MGHRLEKMGDSDPGGGGGEEGVGRGVYFDSRPTGGADK